MKASILYYSKSGHTKQMAEVMAETMAALPDMEARAFDIVVIDDDFFAESDCVILGPPTYVASMAAPVKVWLDQAIRKYPVAGKLCGAFATADYLHGGAEIAIQEILTHFLTMGGLAYSGGGAFGKPVIHLGPVALSEDLAKTEENFRLYAQRMATETKTLFGTSAQ